MIALNGATNYCKSFRRILHYIRELKQRRRRRQQQRQKSNWFRLANNNFACASRFFGHFFAVTALLRRENAYFRVLWRTWTQDHDFLFLLLNFDTVFKDWTPEKWNKRIRWNKRDKVRSSATSLLEWRFRSCLRRCCLSSLLTTPGIVWEDKRYLWLDNVSLNSIGQS